ncbi:glycerol-3-phosphate dehydrogenase [Kistimonas asteriae]|uniref:glycerol-3-phosphate dehydrogenase n=1 Tax=Kistimonas asteriae TaxID=517724 RepID=UPI001BA64081|nr:glycerol-3-phosphate dehydrogenase [Kistimonas asteriae]
MQAVAQPGITAKNPLDMLIIGGGINGVGIARDAAGRGLSVLLCEQADLASATSSASSKLIHGGLRYLEHYEFRLVREALREREVVLKSAPHLVQPMRFQLPHAPHLRPAWMIRCGLFLYDTLARREVLPGCRTVKLDEHSPLKPTFKTTFEYSDCWVDDARLVICNAIAAREKGAKILTRTRCTGAKRLGGANPCWEIQLTQETGETILYYARSLVNAAGPWVASFIENQLQLHPEYGIRMIKGSHIVVPRLHDQPHAYIVQNSDSRIVFVIPWLDKYSIIGTTDMEYEGDPAKAAISEEEIEYLLELVNSSFRKQLTKADIVHTFSGVRPLCNDESSDPSAITRDYTLTVSDQSGHVPLLNVFGGKLTTYRKLAEAALKKLSPWLPESGPTWTANAPLPGGECSDINTCANELTEAYPWLPETVRQRYLGTYGARSKDLLQQCQCLEDLGEHFGNGLYAREVDYLVEQEWAVTTDDILWRRTKTGMEMPASQVNRLCQYLAGHQIPHYERLKPAS